MSGSTESLASTSWALSAPPGRTGRWDSRAGAAPGAQWASPAPRATSALLALAARLDSTVIGDAPDLLGTRVWKAGPARQEATDRLAALDLLGRLALLAPTVLSATPACRALLGRKAPRAQAYSSMSCARANAPARRRRPLAALRAPDKMRQRRRRRQRRQRQLLQRRQQRRQPARRKRPWMRRRLRQIGRASCRERV